jgi:hypothetical protein
MSMTRRIAMMFLVLSMLQFSNSIDTFDLPIYAWQRFARAAIVIVALRLYALDEHQYLTAGKS